MPVRRAAPLSERKPRPRPSLAPGELASLDATAQADLVRRREVSPRELVRAAIERSERVDPGLGSVVIRLFDEARTASRVRTLPPGPFPGGDRGSSVEMNAATSAVSCAASRRCPFATGSICGSRRLSYR